MAQGTPRRRSTHPRTASRKPAPRPTARRPSGSVQGTSRQKPRPTPSKAGTARRQAGPAKRRTIAARARRPRQETAHPRRSAGHGSTDRERDERSHDRATHQDYEGYDAYGDGGYDSDAYDAYADPRGRDSLRLGEHPVLLLTIVLYAVVWVLALVRFWQLTPAGGVLRWALTYLYGLMTVAGFSASAAMGSQHVWGPRRWLVVPLAGLLEMVLVLFTLALYHGVDIEVATLPLYWYLLLGMFVSLLGMLGGLLLTHTRREG